MNKKSLALAALFALIAFAIPIEHKYDKLFRFFSLTLIPEGVNVSAQYEKKIYFYPSDLLSLAVFAITLTRVQWRSFFSHPLWIVGLCALGSILVSPFHSYPIPYFRLWQLLTPLLLFSSLRFLLTEEERSRVTRWIGMAILCAGLFQATVGIFQYFQEAPLGLRILGETHFPATIDTPDGMRWTLDRLFHITHESLSKMRASGTLPHANAYGGFLLLSLLTTYALFLKTEKKWLLATLPFQFFAMMVSYSRSALFGWILASLFWFFWMRKEPQVKKLALTMLVSVALTSFLLYEQIGSRGGIVNYNAAVQAGDSIRHYHQNLSFQILKDHPLFGLGYSQFSERILPYFSEKTPIDARVTAPHNIYLFLACETGLLSLAAFLWFIGKLLHTALFAPKTVASTTLFSLFLSFLFIGLCDFYPILFQQGKLMFFLTAGLLTAHTQPKLKTLYA